MDLSKIDFKTVTADDYDNVISIRSPEYVHDGDDYLPDLYKHLCNTQSTVGYAAVADGEFLAFQFVQLIDDNKAFITRCARVKKNCEGKGVFRALDNYIKQIYEINGRRYMATFSEDNAHFMRKLNTDELRLITTRRFVFNWIYTNDISKGTTNDSYTNHKTRFMSPEDLKHIFQSEVLCRQLFPEGNLICFWATLKPIEANMPLLFFERTKMVGTFEPDCSLITFGTFYRTQIGFIYNLDIYGDAIYNFKAHAQIHFKRLMEQVGKEKICVCIFTENRDNVHIDRFIREYGFQSMEPFLSYHIERK